MLGIHTNKWFFIFPTYVSFLTFGYFVVHGSPRVLIYSTIKMKWKKDIEYNYINLEGLMIQEHTNIHILKYTEQDQKKIC